MSKNRKDPELSTSPEPQPGADFTLRTSSDGDVTVSFSDGSSDLHISRRDFMRISGVAAATAAMSGAACRSPEELIVPYVDRPEEISIGHNQVYASTVNVGNEELGVLVKTRAGRPFKLEGNPNHPLSRGALSARGQASYIDLYDPDRARNPQRIVGERAQDITWENLDTAVRTKLNEVRGGGGVRFLTGTHTGPATRALIDDIVKSMADAKHYTYEVLASEALLQANEAGYGQAHLPYYHFERADLVVSLGSDFLGTWLSPTEFTKQFSSRRTPDGNMNRLVAFESNLSLTGANADDRYRVRPDDLSFVALALAHEIIVEQRHGALAGNNAVRQGLTPFTADAVAAFVGGDVTADVLKNTAQALIAAAGSSIVVAGGDASRTEGGVALEAAVNLLNAALGNDGQTIDHSRPYTQVGGGLADLQALIDEINAGRVEVLIIDEANPVYSAPAELGVAEALQKVPLVVSTGLRVDETAAHAHYLAAGTHSLESWGDSNPRAGVYALQQPVILPLYNNRSFQDSLLHWFGTEEANAELARFLVAPAPAPGNRPGKHGRPTDAGPWYRYLRHHWENTLYPQANIVASFQNFWEATLRQGVWTTTPQATAPQLRPQGLVALLPKALPERQSVQPGDLSRKQLHMFTTIPMYDGRQANNGHLQELPDPITRHTWGSYILVSYKTFQEAKLKTGQLLTVKVEGVDTELTLPVMMQPGLHDDVVAIPFGYGRTAVGDVGNGLGVNAFRLARAAEGRPLTSGLAASITASKKVEKVSKIKGGGVVDPMYHRNLAATTLDAYQKDAQAGMYTDALSKNLWPDHDFGNLKWGMAIDMTKCTGCSACVIACQEENNIPVVGRAGILEGREMHWLRIDRYYKLPEEAVEARRESLTKDPMYQAEPEVAFGEYLERPRVLMQPMLCQHCDRAPCETVCPVLATMQSSDGLNQMSYQRCVGTRYCANNCPYKVRRYNWFNYSEDRSQSFFARLYPQLKDHGRLNQVDPLPLGFNPDVTVRDRGVMEKCTFCVQRIRRGKWQLKKEGRERFHDGEVKTACQQACPADAIEFGNVLDPEHRVTQLHNAGRAMKALPDLNTKPAIAYLSSIWNTDAEKV